MKSFTIIYEKLIEEKLIEEKLIEEKRVTCVIILKERKGLTIINKLTVTHRIKC